MSGDNNERKMGFSPEFIKKNVPCQNITFKKMKKSLKLSRAKALTCLVYSNPDIYVGVNQNRKSIIIWERCLINIT